MAGTPDEQPGQSFRLMPTDALRVVEGNWEWMRAEGFHPYWTGPKEEERQRYREALDEFGSGNVHAGDAFHSESDRPLRHIPETTIYVREEPPAEQP